MQIYFEVNGGFESLDIKVLLGAGLVILVAYLVFYFFMSCAFYRMAKKNNDIDRTVVSAELVETIMQKLGISSSIEELVKSYNMTLPIGFPVFLLNTKPLFKSEDRNKYPECARKVFFPWRDILA